MQTWIAAQTPKRDLWGEREAEILAERRGSLIGHRYSIEEPSSPTSPTSLGRTMSGVRRSRVSEHKLGLDYIVSLEQAFTAHSAAFDMDGDGSISVEELILIFERCNLFDSYFTPAKVRLYFGTLVDGCNHVSGLAAPVGDDGIGFKEFHRVLTWAADMLSIDFRVAAQRIVRMSQKLCDKEASVQRRLEVVFDAHCRACPTHISAFEFGALTRKLNVPISVADIITIFQEIPGVMKEGVDFSGFINTLLAIGNKLEKSDDDVFNIFAKGIELLDTDDETIKLVKSRIKHSAGVVGGKDWQQFLRSCDTDGLGSITWEQFVDICRVKLHLADRDSHLRILFERLDVDGSDQISIERLIELVESGN